MAPSLLAFIIPGPISSRVEARKSFYLENQQQHHEGLSEINSITSLTQKNLILFNRINVARPGGQVARLKMMKP